jgi:hypothetical protein
MEQRADLEHPAAVERARAVGAHRAEGERQRPLVGRDERERQRPRAAVLDAEDPPRPEIEVVDRRRPGGERLAALLGGQGRGVGQLDHRRRAARQRELELHRVGDVGARRIVPVDPHLVALAALEHRRQAIDRQHRRGRAAVAHGAAVAVDRPAGELPATAAALLGRRRELGRIGERAGDAGRRQHHRAEHERPPHGAPLDVAHASSAA